MTRLERLESLLEGRHGGGCVGGGGELAVAAKLRDKLLSGMEEGKLLAGSGPRHGLGKGMVKLKGV